MKKSERGLLTDIRVIVLLLCVFAALFAIYVYPPPPVTAKVNADIDESAVSSFLKKELGAEVNYEGEGIYEIRPGVSEERLSEALKGINGSIAEKANEEPFFYGAGLNGNLRFGLDLVGGTQLELKLEGILVRIDAPASVNASTVREFLEKELDTEVTPYKTDKEGTYEYEIRKRVTKEQLSEVLKGINGTIAKKPTGEDFFEEAVTQGTIDETRQIIDTKINMLGLASTTIRTVGNNLMIIDFAGIDIRTAKDIVGNPGKFEIRMQTEGVGGDVRKGQRLEEIDNITAHVMYGSEGIERVETVPKSQTQSWRGEVIEEWGAPFSLTEEGATALRDSAIEHGAINNPADHQLAMLLDDEVVYSAPIADDACKRLEEELIYSWTANTGTGDEGKSDARELIIHLKAGALPVNVKVIGSGEVPAYLGAKFKEGAIIAGLFALISVTLVVFLRYREKKIVLPMFFALLSEVILILGFATVFNWQLDLPSIAGIIAVIGTGVDQLVIITDEVLSGGRSSTRMYRKRISFAFGIIFVSAATTIVAMSALAYATYQALTALTGFALVIIVGLLFGILITRPAYARIIETIL
ncbi:MAG TPA: preprotein translocase subunit SecD [Syntrophaceae bacterium]|nr:preprotein translocase subunit SecD [Syntrophaceae bacterium]